MSAVTAAEAAQAVRLVRRGLSSLEAACLVHGIGWREVERLAEAEGIPPAASRVSRRPWQIRAALVITPVGEPT